MAVKTGVAKQSLGFVEEKLRRVFNLAGPIDASLDPEVKPVIIVDDLRDPGHAFFQGRSWAAVVTHFTIGAGVKAAGMKFNNDVVIEGVDIRTAAVMSAAAGTYLALFLTTPAEEIATPPVGAITALRATWRDDKRTGTIGAYDQPPIAASANFSAIVGVASGVGNTLWQSIPGGASPGYIPLKLFMPRGSGLYLEENAVTDISWSVFGRIYPQ